MRRDDLASPARVRDSSLRVQVPNYNNHIFSKIVVIELNPSDAEGFRGT